MNIIPNKLLKYESAIIEIHIHNDDEKVLRLNHFRIIRGKQAVVKTIVAKQNAMKTMPIAYNLPRKKLSKKKPKN